LAFLGKIDMVTSNVVIGCYNIVCCHMTISCQTTNGCAKGLPDRPTGRCEEGC
jgi:hypothetical protein